MFWVSGMLRPGRPGVRGPMPYFFGEPRQVPGCLLDSQKSRWRSGTQNIPSLGRWQNGMMIIDHHKWSTFIENNGMINHHLFLNFFVLFYDPNQIIYDQLIVNQESFVWHFNDVSMIIIQLFRGMAMDGHGWSLRRSLGKVVGVAPIGVASLHGASGQEAQNGKDTWWIRSKWSTYDPHIIWSISRIHIWSI